MSKSIILGCYEVPGYGGASTATYQLFQRLRRDNLEVSYLNLIDELDADYFRYTCGESFGNPDNSDHVFNLVLNGPLYGSQPELMALLEERSPDLMIGVDSIASLLLKRAAPDRKLIFMTAGCQTVQDLIFRNGSDFTNQRQLFGRWVGPKLNSEEFEAVQISDLIISHSDLTHYLYKTFYPFYSGKLLSEVIWFGEWIYEEAQKYSQMKKPFDERDIDVLFAASSWSRREKNYALVGKIAARLKSGARIHIVGEVNERYPHATYHGLVMKREKLFELMGRAKTVVCPSIFEAAPGILFEASAMGCNVIASKNCGNWKLCHEDLLVDPFGLPQFEKAIEISLTQKFDDHMDFFLQTKSYQNLIDTIAVM